MKRIVAVVFEDGTEATVADMQTIVQYVNSFGLQQSLRALASDPDIDWDARGQALDQWNAARLEKKRKMLASRRKPRGKGKDVTPEIARATLERVVADEDQKWGSTKKAAKDLGVSKRTLNRRMKNSAP